MDAEMSARMEAAGFRTTSVQELFALTAEEVELIETRLALSRLIRRLRTNHNLTQKALAARLGSDQGNVSKAEQNDAAISIEWMLRAAYALGADRKEVAQAICG
jgi:DNA-binding transcriptional regulator YiaG